MEHQKYQSSARLLARKFSLAENNRLAAFSAWGLSMSMPPNKANDAAILPAIGRAGQDVRSMT